MTSSQQRPSTASTPEERGDERADHEPAWSTGPQRETCLRSIDPSTEGSLWPGWQGFCIVARPESTTDLAFAYWPAFRRNDACALRVAPQARTLRWLAGSVGATALQASGVRIEECVFLPRGQLPKTPSGKIQRYRCREIAADPIAGTGMRLRVPVAPD